MLQKLGQTAPIGTAALARERTRIPMSTPVQKLAVGDIPGYHLHWFNGTPDRIERAKQGGYEFVTPEEVLIANTGLGSDTAVSGSTDMGSLVSKVAGTELGTDGQPVRLVLMKIKQEFWNEDQAVLMARNDKVRDALLGGLIGSENDARGDSNKRYVDKSRTQIPDFFKRKATLVKPTAQP